MKDILFFMIPIIAVGGFFGWMLAISPVGKAVADRIRGRSTADEHPDRDATLVQQLQQRVAELEERVDFTERLLAKNRDERLPPGR